MLIHDKTNYNTYFTSRKPKNFGQVMNLIYRRVHRQYGNVFENSDVIKLSTKIDGRIITGFASFRKGRYVALSMDKAFSDLRKEFMLTIYQKFSQNYSKGKHNSHGHHLKPNRRLNKHQLFEMA